MSSGGPKNCIEIYNETRAITQRYETIRSVKFAIVLCAVLSTVVVLLDTILGLGRKLPSDTHTVPAHVEQEAAGDSHKLSEEEEQFKRIAESFLNYQN